jgi:hypothetical protein
MRRSGLYQPPRRYSTLAERQDMVEQFRKSGLTQADFAAEHRLSLSTLTRWLGDSRAWHGKEKPERNGAGVQFHSLAFPATPAWGAEVQLPNGAMVRLHANTSPELAAAVLRASR